MKIFLILVICFSLFSLVYAETDEILWKKTFGTENNDYARCIEQTEDGGFIVLAETEYDYDRRIWLLKLDSNCDSLWSRVYDIPGEESPSLLRQTSDGGFIITGTSQMSFSPDDYDMFLLKTDSAGNCQ